MATVFETERLRARPLTEDDVEACFAIYSDPEVTRYVVPGGATAPDVGYVSDMIASGILARRTDPRFGFWALERREDELLVGTVALVPVDDTDDHEMGWHLAPAWWGHGFAFESGIALIGYGLALGLDRVLAIVHTRNERSQRACRRLGLTHVDRRLHEWHEHDFFAADRETWRRPLPGTSGGPTA